MCIGLPMQVLAVRPGHATVLRGDERRDVRTALIGEVAPGDWLLVFLHDARERLTPERAAEVAATLALVEAAIAGEASAGADAAFDLPSSWCPDRLEAFR